MVAIHKTLSSVLQLGNIQFIQDKVSEQAALPDNTGNVAFRINGNLSSDGIVIFICKSFSHRWIQH